MDCLVDWYDELPSVKRFCFCFPLKIGCIVIGCLSIFNVIFLYCFSDYISRRTESSSRVIYTVVLYVGLLMCIVVSVLAVILIIALLTDNANLTFPWIMGCSICLILEIIIVILLVGLLSVMPNVKKRFFLVMDTLISGIFMIVCTLYAIIIVNSYRKTIDNT